jgi:hypothetical protein
VKLDGDVWSWYLNNIKGVADISHLPRTPVHVVSIRPESAVEFERRIVRRFRMTSEMLVLEVCRIAFEYLSHICGTPYKISALIANVLNQSWLKSSSERRSKYLMVHDSGPSFEIVFSESELRIAKRDMKVPLRNVSVDGSFEMRKFDDDGFSELAFLGLDGEAAINRLIPSMVSAYLEESKNRDSRGPFEDYLNVTKWSFVMPPEQTGEWTTGQVWELP